MKVRKVKVWKRARYMHPLLFSLSFLAVWTTQKLVFALSLQNLPIRDLGLEGTPHSFAPEILSSEVNNQPYACNILLGVYVLCSCKVVWVKWHSCALVVATLTPAWAPQKSKVVLLIHHWRLRPFTNLLNIHFVLLLSHVCARLLLFSKMAVQFALV